jgi:uncharacterized protein (PEP-CTERM system associated)
LPSKPPQRSGFAKPHVGPVGAGVLAVLAGFPVLAQVGAFPPAEPTQEEGRHSETEPAPAGVAPAPGAPAAPASPFGLSPNVYPGLPGGQPEAAGAPAAPASPFGLSPDVFPGLLGGRPDRRIQEQPVLPSESGLPAAPGVPPETAPGPEAAAPAGPPPGLEPEAAPPAYPPAPPAFFTPPYGFGNLTPGPLLAPNPPAPVAPPAPPLTTALAPLRPGSLPVQAYDLRAPPILIRSSLSAFLGYTDNPRSTPGNFSDALARLGGNTAISVDTVRLQGQLSGGLNYLKYARATDQDTLNVNLLAYGLGTVVQDHLFIDARAAITQFSRSGGLGFAPTAVIPRSQQTQVITTSLTPIARQSFGRYVDSELRYNYAIVRSDQGSLFGNGTVPPPVPTSTNLQDATRNEVTATLATGRLFTTFGSKLTLDAMKTDSQSAARTKQLRAYDDLSYQFNQRFAGLARIGYENLDFPLQPGASFTGPAWTIGGRYTPFPGSYLVANYGRQEGLTGFSGSLRYELTPLTVLMASYSRNRASQQQQILNNLNASGVDAFGNLIDQSSGLPTALTNPQFPLTNAVFKFETASAGLQTRLERNSFGLFGFFQRRSQLGTPLPPAAAAATGSDTSGGVNFSWGRSLTPSLSSSATLGYIVETTDSQKTLTASLSMTYLLSERLSAILQYQFINVDSAAIGGSYRRNQVEIGLTRSF